MGVLTCGNIGSDKVQEFETISCPHCCQVRAIVMRGCTKEMKYNHWCPRCRKPICKGCAAVMEKLGQCPGPFIARVEAEMAAGHALQDFAYQYQSVTRM